MKRIVPHKLLLRLLLWMTGVPAVLVLALYIVLWITPVPAPFIGDQARIAAAKALPPNFSVTFGGTEIALESGLWPVVRFTPVEMKDAHSGADIDIEAVEIGFSPVRALIGQPGLSVILVRPHLQVVQDLFGPRLAG